MRPARVKVNNPVALSGAVLRKLVFKEQAVIFHPLSGLEVQIKMVADLVYGKVSLSGFVDAELHVAESREDLFHCWLFGHSLLLKSTMQRARERNVKAVWA